MMTALCDTNKRKQVSNVAAGWMSLLRKCFIGQIPALFAGGGAERAKAWVEGYVVAKEPMDGLVFGATVDDGTGTIPIVVAEKRTASSASVPVGSRVMAHLAFRGGHAVAHKLAVHTADPNDETMWIAEVLDIQQRAPPAPAPSSAASTLSPV